MAFETSNESDNEHLDQETFTRDKTRKTSTFGSAFSSGGFRTFLRFDLFRLICCFFLLGSGRDFDLAHVAVVVDDFLKGKVKGIY